MGQVVTISNLLGIAIPMWGLFFFFAYQVKALKKRVDALEKRNNASPAPLK